MGCRYNLFLDVTYAGSIDFARPFDDPAESLEAMPETCALDVADRGGTTLEEVGGLVQVTRERVRQIEQTALRKMRLLSDAVLHVPMPVPEPE